MTETDVVERLRDYATIVDASATEHEIPAFARKAHDLRAAANEITRLRTELVEERHIVLELQRDLFGPLPSGNKTRFEKEVGRLRSQNATMLEALEGAAKVVVSKAAVWRIEVGRADNEIERKHYESMVRAAEWCEAAIRALTQAAPAPTPRDEGEG